MYAFEILSCDLFKGAGNHAPIEDVVQNARVVHILGFLFQSKHRDFNGQMGIGKELFPLAVGRYRHPIIQIILRGRLSVLHSINVFTPRNHIDGIIVHQLQLGKKLYNVVAYTRAGHRQLVPAAPEAVQYGLGTLAV